MPNTRIGFFSPEQAKELESSIREAELKTAGEIRIHLEADCEDPIERAKIVFQYLKMDRTEARNGILFYLAIESHAFAVLGDEGIHEKVGQEFWDTIRDAMTAEFKQGNFVAGLKHGVAACGEQLGRHFPRKPEDKNELPDAISFGP
jgi:uncharacterized membrane protein